MKTSVLLWTCLAAQYASAFPSQLSEAMLRIRNSDPDRQAEMLEQAKLEARCPFSKEKREAEAEPGCPFAKGQVAKRQAPGVTPPFDAGQQYVSNTGDHAFVAPSGSDQRGPCPGLNAMANHGYMPHNGVGSLQDFIDGTQAAFGMGADLASFLAVYGAIFDGDLTSYSIGGPVNGLLNLGGLLGAPQGLSGSHNKYEGDASPTRGDLYQTGNDYLLQLAQFKELYALGQQNNDSIDLSVLTAYRNTRFTQSIDNNPYFFNAPFAGVIAQPAAWSFIYRFMANKSAEYPEGLLTGDVLKSFYSVTGDTPDSFVYTPGHEKIPDNWYKRNLVDYYTIPYLSIDSNVMALQHPEFLAVGGNTGTGNSFVGVDIQNLTSGVYSADDLLKGKNGFCFGFEAGLQEAPDFLSGIYENVGPALDKLSTAISQAESGLGCEKLAKISEDQFAQYPGYTKLSTQGTY